MALFPKLATSPNCRLKKLTQIFSTRIKDAAVAISLPEKMLCAVATPSEALRIISLGFSAVDAYGLTRERVGVARIV